MSLKGNLEVLNLSDIFQSLSLNQHTGTLKVTDGRREKLIYFAQGEISLLSSDKKLKIGEMLVAQEKVSKEDLDYALNIQKKSKKRLGEILVDDGFVTDEDVADVVRKQIEEEIYDLFLWKQADFEFLIDYCPDKLKNPGHNITRLQFNTNSLIMEALRRLDEWELISKEIPTLKEVFKVVKDGERALDEIELPDRVKAEVRLLDGDSTVEELVEKTILSEFELCKLLSELKIKRAIVPLSAQELQDRADEAFRKNDFRKASALFERLVELLPKSLPLRWQLAESRKLFGDEARALEQYEQIAKRLEGTRDAAQLMRAYEAILDLAPDRKEVREKLSALGRHRFRRLFLRYAAVSLVVAAAGVGGFLLLTETRFIGTAVDWLAKKISGDRTGGSGSAAAEEEGARKLYESGEKLIKQQRYKEAFDQMLELRRLYPTTLANEEVVFPISIRSYPPGKSVWINGTYKGETDGVFLYKPKGAIELELREGNRLIARQTLDPLVYHELVVDLYRKPLFFVTTDGAVRARPAVARGIVFFASFDGYLYGVKSDSRAVVMQQPLRDGGDPFGELSSGPSVVAGAAPVAIVATASGDVRAYDLPDGPNALRLRYKRSLGTEEPVLARPAIGPDGDTAIFGGHDGSIIFYSLRRQVVVGTVLTGNRVTAPIAVSGGIAYAASCDNWVRAIDIPSRRLLWYYEGGTDFVAGPHVARAGELVVVGDRSGRVAAIEARTGRALWEFTASAGISGGFSDLGGRLFFGADDGYLYALDLSTGRELWRVPLGLRVGAPVATAAAVYAGTADGFLKAVDPVSGQERWSARGGGPFRGAPLLDAGRLYIGCDDMRLYCFEVE